MFYVEEFPKAVPSRTRVEEECKAVQNTIQEKSFYSRIL